MTTRLYCRECGWNHSYRTRRNARRAAGRHACAIAPHMQTTAPQWLRFWKRSTGRRPVGFDAPNLVDTGTEVVRTYSDRIQAAVLAAHHAETTQRARRAMVELVRAGYQIGPAPYGYRTLRIRVTAATGHARFRGRAGAGLAHRWSGRADLLLARGPGNGVPRDRPSTQHRTAPIPVPVRDRTVDSRRSQACSHQPALHRPPSLGPHRRRPAGPGRAMGHLGTDGPRAADR